MKSVGTLAAPALTVLALVIIPGSTTAAAQGLDCAVVEAIGNAASGSIIRQINQQVAGDVTKINRRKQLRINEVRTLSFDGCDLRSEIHVTLKRKLRRDAHGTVTIGARAASLTRTEVCLTNIKVKDVSLSRTLKIGERFYERVANRAISDRSCFGLPRASTDDRGSRDIRAALLPER